MNALYLTPNAMIRKSASVLVGAFLLAAPLIASAQSADVQAQIDALLARIKQLQALIAQLQQAKTSSASAANCVNLASNLYLGKIDASTGGDVTRLQQFLGGRVSGYFGPATLQLVQNWQAAHGIVSSGSPETTGYGYVGAKTRRAMSCATVLSVMRYESIFPHPYAVTWQGGDITYSVVGAFIGEAQIPPDAGIPSNPTNRGILDPLGNPYPVGSKVHVVKLYVKPSAQGYNDYYDPYDDIKRAVNSEGDTVPTSITGIASTLGPSTVVDGVRTPEVWFIVPEGQTRFAFSTGYRSSPQNIGFTVTGQSDGSVMITSNIVTFSASPSYGRAPHIAVGFLYSDPAPAKRYFIDFGDGNRTQMQEREEAIICDASYPSTACTKIPAHYESSHEYASAGTYIVVLKDDASGALLSTITITVVPTADVPEVTEGDPGPY